MQWKPRFSMGQTLISIRNFHICCPIWVKSRIRVLHITLLSLCEFREYRRWESRTPVPWNRMAIYDTVQTVQHGIHNFQSCLTPKLAVNTKYKTQSLTSLFFQPNAHNMLNTSIYHQLPVTYFSVRYNIFRQTIALLAQKLYAFCNVATQCTIYPFFNLQCC